MKKFYAILCLAIASLTQLQAQAPQGFNYQATVRNSAGDLIVNTNVYFKFNVMQGSQTSLPVFTEIHYVPTDDLGQVNLVIGQGTATTGAFSELDWSLGSYYLGIELDTGSGYVAMGTTQLLSVPYALYAENSGNSTPTTPNLETVLAENNSANNQQIKNLQDPTDAQDAVTLAYITQLETSLQDLQNQLQEQNQNIDNDFDGFSENNGDCDDTNAQVYTGAEEICDGLDNDCDGLVDEDAGSIFYQDSDGDGFGSSTTVQTCTQPLGYVAQGGDCDDSDATINPNAVEVCDGIDNNCDGVVDEGLTSTFYQDLDGDGFGSSTTVQTCTQPLGYVAQGGDCNDSDATINPDAVEVCDGIDNNCNGGFDEEVINISIQPLAEQTVCFGDALSPLVVEYDNENETPSYQWYSTTTCDTSDTSLPIVGATSSSYTPPSDTAGSFYYFVVLNFGGSCAPLTSQCALVNIEELPQINITPASQVLCIGEVTQPIVFSTSNTSGTTTYTWTNDNPNIGLSSSGTGNIPSFTVVNAGSIPIVATITVTPMYSNNSVSCEGPPEVLTITVNPLGQVNQVAEITVINGEAVQPIVFSTSNTSGTTTYTWTNDNLNIGLSSSGTGNIASFYAINSSSSSITANLTVTPIFSNGQINCEGPSENFTITVYPTSGSITDIEGNQYDYLTYGTQQWTVKNAEMVTYRDGTPIPQVTDPSDWFNLTTGAWCYLNNDPTQPIVYNWYAVMGIHDAASLSNPTLRKEFAPEGWHIPSDTEWTTLENYLITNGYNYDGTTTGNKIAKSMASATSWYYSSVAGAPGNDYSSNNSSDFNALPVGQRNNAGTFYGGNNSSTFFWSSSSFVNEFDQERSWTRYMSANMIDLVRSNVPFQSGYSVRFVRD